MTTGNFKILESIFIQPVCSSPREFANHVTIVPREAAQEKRRKVVLEYLETGDILFGNSLVNGVVGWMAFKCRTHGNNAFSDIKSEFLSTFKRKCS